MGTPYQGYIYSKKLLLKYFTTCMLCITWFTQSTRSLACGFLNTTHIGSIYSLFDYFHMTSFLYGTVLCLLYIFEDKNWIQLYRNNPWESDHPVLTNAKVQQLNYGVVVFDVNYLLMVYARVLLQPILCSCESGLSMCINCQIKNQIYLFW